MRGSVALAGALLVAAVAPLAVAVDPLGNDAGSGSDAPDRRELALAVPHGEHSGRVAYQTDAQDWYSFEVTGGRFVEIGFDADAWYMGGWLEDSDSQFQAFVGHGERQRFYAPVEATWRLGVSIANLILENGRPLVPLGPHDYRFSIGEWVPPFLHVFNATGEWSALEATWEAGDRPILLAGVRGIVGQPLVEPLACMQMDEGRIRLPAHDEYEFQGGVHLSASSFSHTLRVSPSPLPEWRLDLPRPVEGWGGVGVGLSAGDSTGSLRVTSYCAGADRTEFSFLLAAERPFEWRTESGGGVLAWSENNAGAERQVLTPVASATGPRERTEPLDGTFIGFFQVPPGAEGRVVEPSGVSHQANGEFFFLFDLPEGEWRFEVGETVGAGFLTAQNNLDGAAIPLLGLTEPVVFPSL